MTAALLRKEWQQHWLAAVLLTLLTFATAGLIAAGHLTRGLSGSLFETQLIMLRFVFPLVAWIIGQRLIALEFREKTQLFLEALPLPRWRLIAVKYLCGLAFALLLTLGTLGLVAFLGREVEFLTPRYLAILAARTALWTWAALTFCFVIGFFGRYRLVFLLGLATIYGLVDHLTDFRPADFGPFALVDGRFPFESLHFPVAALRTTAAISLGLLALVFILGVARDGTIGARLGERMAQSEKLFLGAVCLAGLVIFGVLSQRSQRTPFDLPGATEESRGEVVVKVAVNREEERPRAAALAARVADDLAALRQFLGVEKLPGVFIVLRTDFAADRFERVKSDESHDLVVRANFTAKDFSERDFRLALLRNLLLQRSHDRLLIEEQAWVLEGFALYWISRDQPDAATDLRKDVRAAAPDGFTLAEFRAWHRLAKRLGEKPARTVAWSALHSLEQRHGEEALRTFLRSVLREVRAMDARATWHDLTHPVSARLAAAAGVPFAQFFAEWQQDLRKP